MWVELEWWRSGVAGGMRIEEDEVEVGQLVDGGDGFGDVLGSIGG